MIGIDSCSCNCKKTVKELNYVEKKYNSGWGVRSHEGNVTIKDDGTRTLYTKINKHFFYLNNCAGSHVKISEGYTYNVIQKDIDKWKEYLIKNCPADYKKYYKPSKIYQRTVDYEIDVKIKN